MGTIHVFGTVRRIGKGLAAALVLACIWPLSSVRTEVRLEVLESGVSFLTTFILKGKEVLWRGGGGEEGGGRKPEDRQIER